ncbi:glycosyl hydrolase [Gottschalkia acidurici]|nr:glycosyl hydrolase [Gottschalkia acidurici]
MIKRILILTFIVSFTLIGCASKEGENYTKKETTIEGGALSEDNKKSDKNKKERKISVWTTYWDTVDLENEFDKISGNIKDISYFAVYFDENEKLFIPDEIEATNEMIKKRYPKYNYGSYLTFVNDLLRKDEASSLKDKDLLYRLFSTEESMNNHVKEILSMTIKGGYSGVEIDYEAIGKDVILWNSFLKFVEKLYTEAIKKDIDVRIVLEPNFPEESITFPKGPEYVIMCYNLHGYGTTPGPKANKEFILKMIEKMKKLPGNINFAMSTGGFKFYGDKVEQLSEKEAVELAKMYDATIIRDEDSKARYFTYVDDESVSYEVWYADHETLDFWFSIVEESGDYGLSLWRMGGNLSILQ